MTMVKSNPLTATNRGSPPGQTCRFEPKMGVLMHIYTLWCKKISLDNNARQWVVIGHQQSKKEWGFALLTKRRQIKIWIFGHGFPAQNISKENAVVKENVWLVPMRIFGLFYFSRQIKSNLGKIASYTSHSFLHLTMSLPLSLILRERWRHELPSFSPLIFCSYWQPIKVFSSLISCWFFICGGKCHKLVILYCTNRTFGYNPYITRVFLACQAKARR